MQFIKIDSEFQSLLRSLTPDEYKSLEDSIKQDGCLRPIELWNGYIADGHNRYSICMKNGISFDQVDVTEKFETKSDVMKWIVQNQRARQTGRQLSKTELLKMAEAVEKQVAVEANQARLEGNAKGGQGKSSSNLNETSEPIRTAAKAAEAIGVSENTYRDMKLVAEKGSEEQIERMNRGGRGNAPSTIAKEIKGSKISEVRKCKVCGQVLPIKNFQLTGSTHRYICKKCRSRRDDERRGERKEEIRLEGTEGFYVDSVEEKIWTPEEIVEQMERDFDSYIDGLKIEIAIHRKEIRMHESVLDDAIDKFLIRLRSVKGEYR